MSHGFKTNGVAITSVKRKLNFAFTTQGTQVELYSTDEFKHVSTYEGHYKPINALAFHTATHFITVSNQIVIHDVSKTEPMRKIHLNDASELSDYNRLKITDVCALSEDVIAICDENRFVKVYDLRQGTMFKPIQRFRDSRDSLNTLEYDDFKLVTGGSEGVVYTYDLRKGLLMRDPLGQCITDLQLCKQQQQQQVVLNTFGGVVWMQDGQVKRREHKNSDDAEYLVDVGVHDGTVMTGSEHGCVYIWGERGVDVRKLGNSVVGAVDMGEWACCGDNEGTLYILEDIIRHGYLR